MEISSGSYPRPQPSSGILNNRNHESTSMEINSESYPQPNPQLGSSSHRSRGSASMEISSGSYPRPKSELLSERSAESRSRGFRKRPRQCKNPSAERYSPSSNFPERNPYVEPERSQNSRVGLNSPRSPLINRPLRRQESLDSQSSTGSN